MLYVPTVGIYVSSITSRADETDTDSFAARWRGWKMGVTTLGAVVAAIVMLAVLLVSYYN